MSLAWCAGLILALFAGPALSSEIRRDDVLRVLTVGNSFAYNATKYLPQLAPSSGRKLILGHANYTGCSLEQHWNAAVAAEAGQPEGAIYPPRSDGAPKRALREILREQPWDIVTIQQASRLSDETSTYEPFARNLRDYIKRYAPQAEVLFHQTWAYRADNPKFSKGGSPATMHEAVKNACRSTAQELGLGVIPVGDAFHLAMLQPEWTFSPDPTFDPSTIKFPDEPPQPGSLHKGWSWIKKPDGTWTFWNDSTHANNYGCYLGSCVFFQSLFGEPPPENAFVPEDIAPAVAEDLRKIAREAASAPSEHASTPISPR